MRKILFILILVVKLVYTSEFSLSEVNELLYSKNKEETEINKLKVEKENLNFVRFYSLFWFIDFFNTFITIDFDSDSDSDSILLLKESLISLFFNLEKLAVEVKIFYEKFYLLDKFMEKNKLDLKKLHKNFLDVYKELNFVNNFFRIEKCEEEKFCFYSILCEIFSVMSISLQNLFPNLKDVFSQEFAKKTIKNHSSFVIGILMETYEFCENSMEENNFFEKQSELSFIFKKTKDDIKNINDYLDGLRVCLTWRISMRQLTVGLKFFKDISKTLIDEIVLYNIKDEKTDAYIYLIENMFIFENNEFDDFFYISFY